MPLLTNACLDVEPGCCDALFAFAEHLRCESLDALGQFFVDGYCATGFQSYVAMGTGDDGQLDALTVAVLQMNPSPGTQAKGFSLWNMTFDVRLRESGYPMASLDAGGRILAPPDPVAQAKATHQLMQHGEAIHRRLSSLKSKGALAPDGYRCLTGTVGALQPVNPLGGVAGWSILVTVQMPWS